jgi:hypothetical protein
MGRAQRVLERAQLHPGLRDYLLVGEEIRFAVRRHWVVLVRPLLAWVGVTSLSLLVFVEAPGRLGSALPWVLVGVMSVMWLRFVWGLIFWRLELFVVTDKRLLKYQGVVQIGVPVMPLAKVTDLTYHQPFVGEILRFGTFVLESAGQQQAMHDIEYVPHTPNYYRLITAAVHAMPPDERDAHLVLPGLPWWGRAQLIRTATRAELIASGQAAPDAPDDSRAIPIQPPFSSGIPTHRPASDGEVLFESADIAARRRTADTGPIRYYPTNDPD